MNEIESKKNNFLEKYNYDRSKKVAITKAISAASVSLHKWHLNLEGLDKYPSKNKTQ